jgi:hypothetical protein
MNKIEIPTDPQLATILVNHQQQERLIQAGTLGRFFGSNENVRVYIVGLIALLILIVGLVYTVIPDSWRSQGFPISNMWGVISPILTTIIGYLIGSKAK